MLACGFNPRPPLLAGESSLHRAQKRAGPVSIHARHCWRANRLARRGGRQRTRFNPRPPLLAGESMLNGAVRAMMDVSIHARHCWRANPRLAQDAIQRGGVSIHARHCWRANLSRRSSTASGSPFQSTPAIAGGRIDQPPPFFGRRGGFNPRPPLLAGESPILRAVPVVQVCFNPRPPLLAGESGCRVVGGNVLLVSIHARHCWRANLHRCANGTLLVCFNPRPPLLAGESRCCGGFMSSEHGFNPRPPLLAGESSDSWPVLMPPSGFNPRPPLLAGESKM